MIPLISPQRVSQEVSRRLGRELPCLLTENGYRFAWERRFLLVPGEELRDLPAHLQAPLWDLGPMFPDFNAERGKVRCGECVLERQVFHFQVQADLREKAPMHFDYRTNWKRHPPSKRKRMRSWRYAPDEVKRCYAPCKNGVIPLWARHPDKFRTVVRGRVEVWAEYLVWAVPGADTDEVQRLAERDMHETRRALTALTLPDLNATKGTRRETDLNRPHQPNPF